MANVKIIDASKIGTTEQLEAIISKAISEGCEVSTTVNHLIVMVNGKTINVECGNIKGESLIDTVKAVTKRNKN